MELKIWFKTTNLRMYFLMHTKNKFSGSTTTVLPLLLLLLFGCNLKRETVVSPIDSVITDSVILPISIEDRKGGVQFYKEGVKNCIAYITKSDFLLHIVDLAHQNQIDSISLIKYKAFYSAHYVRNKDSVFILLNNNVLVLSMPGKEKIWNLNAIVKGIDSFSYTGYSGNPLSINGDTVAIELFNTKAKDNNNVYKQNCYSLLIKLNPDTAILLGKINPYFPHLYQNDYHAYSKRNLIAGNKLLFSFSYADTIWKYDFEQNRTDFIALHSSFFKENKSFDYTQNFNYKYSNEYEVSQSRAGILFYQPSKKYIYMFMKHGAKPVEEDGTVNEYYDCPFSLFLVSENLKQQKEFYIPSNFTDNLFLSFCDDEYLYVPADENKQTIKDQTKYYRLKLNF